ncbi:hypothetical protein DL546_004558 [Coniochaeta pulveracea]|uniref:Uncharacterized protein n=1 Tax=Coniochaeta pulveracea TaxID=177199 RepID=A0A420YKX3_9PEZI|nr:hypothetical protein DL546_004558 [Coniochaeta pulveracea]
MCEYAEGTYVYNGCAMKEMVDKHRVQVRAYRLCDKGVETRKHCPGATHTTQVIIGSSRTAGKCPTCEEGLVSKTIYLN